MKYDDDFLLDDELPFDDQLPTDEKGWLLWTEQQTLRYNSLGECMRRLRDVLNKNNFPRRVAELDALEGDYTLMLDAVRMGYPDAQRGRVHQQLCRRLTRIVRDTLLDYKLTHDQPLAAMGQRYMNVELDEDDIQRHLEDFVQDVAMLSLESADQQAVHRAGLFEKHYAYVNRLFEALAFSHQWSEAFRTFMSGLITSPTVDSNDAQMLVSAIMLAVLLNYDPQKVMALLDIYEQAKDEHIRQRALVGWLLVFRQAPYGFYQEVTDRITALLSGKEVRQEILEFEMQFFYCTNAEKDNQQMQKDIIPTLMKNRGFEITSEGIKEKEDDPMEDILHADAADKRMEELEQSIQKMMDLRKQGADIYFGGFRQMKRFAFFYTLSNWFAPFFIDHPQLQSLSKEVMQSTIVQTIGEKGPFCDSDKYSFTIGLSSVFSRLPKNIQEIMMNSAEMELPYSEDTSKAAYIRRMYLQDLYRFFNISDMRKLFSNPFDGTQNLRRLACQEKCFRTAFGDEARSLMQFFYKKKLYQRVMSIMDAYQAKTSEDYVMGGYCQIHGGHYAEALLFFQQAYELDDASEAALKGLAQASLLAGHYQDAAGHYQMLLDQHPDHKLYLLNCSVAQVNSDHVEEGLQGLYQLRYEHKDDLKVTRALAWGLLMAGRFDDAYALYADMLGGSEATAADYLNAAYSLWLNKHLDQAVPLMRKYLEQSEVATDQQYKALCQCFHEDNHLLSKFQVTTLDQQLVADLVSRATQA